MSATKIAKAWAAGNKKIIWYLVILDGIPQTFRVQTSLSFALELRRLRCEPSAMSFDFRFLHHRRFRAKPMGGGVNNHLPDISTGLAEYSSLELLTGQTKKVEGDEVYNWLSVIVQAPRETHQGRCSCSLTYLIGHFFVGANVPSFELATLGPLDA